ncbi:MAG: universal stress protein [Proteobacteria bacterium]|nr:universal stress protein [Pseudomonadota bacterium]
MNPKVILVPFSSHDQDGAALEYAFHLAASYEASVQAWHIAPDPETIATSYAYEPMVIYPEASIREMKDANEISRRDAEEKFLSMARSAKAKKASFHSTVGLAADIIAVRGRVVDLIVVGRTDERINGDGLINGALFGSGHPMILIPPDSQTKKINGDILISWNGSLEAAHAVAFALPYMKHGKIWVLTEIEEELGSSSLTIEDLVGYLSLHNISVDKAMIHMRETSSLPASILNTARTLNVDMIVMGAWGHSRIREYIFGGVTHFMLHHADIPILMAH